MSIKEAFSNLSMSDKERMAMVATPRGVDLEKVFNALDGVWEIIAPEYRKNLAALGVDQGSADGDKTIIATGITGKSNHTIIIDEQIGSEGWETDPESLRASRNKRCNQCGVIQFDDEDLCPECKEDQDNG